MNILKIAAVAIVAASLTACATANIADAPTCLKPGELQMFRGDKPMRCADKPLWVVNAGASGDLWPGY